MQLLSDHFAQGFIRVFSPAPFLSTSELALLSAKVAAYSSCEVMLATAWFLSWRTRRASFALRSTMPFRAALSLLPQRFRRSFLRLNAFFCCGVFGVRLMLTKVARMALVCNGGDGRLAA